MIGFNKKEENKKNLTAKQANFICLILNNIKDGRWDIFITWHFKPMPFVGLLPLNPIIPQLSSSYQRNVF